MEIVRDWIALPFVLMGSYLYSIGEWISGKKFSRRADMVMAESEINAYNSLNRKGRRALNSRK